MLGWMKHKLESRLPGEIWITSDRRWHHTYGKKWRRAKEPLDKSERGEWKVGLKLNILKTTTIASGPITWWQIDGEKVERVTDFILGASKITSDCDCSHGTGRRKILAPWKGSYDQSRQHIERQRHYFANKGPSSQRYGFSSSHVWMWELDYKESWVPKNWCFWTVALEKTLKGPGDPTNPS